MFLRITIFQIVYQEFGLLFPSPVSLGIGPHTAYNVLITHSFTGDHNPFISFTFLAHNLPERILLLISSNYSDFLTYLPF
jgi:hypothetical protein